MRAARSKTWCVKIAWHTLGKEEVFELKAVVGSERDDVRAAGCGMFVEVVIL